MQSKEKKKPTDIPALIFKTFATIMLTVMQIVVLFGIFEDGLYFLIIIFIILLFILLLMWFPTEVIEIFSNIWKFFRKKKSIIPPHLFDLSSLILFVPAIIGIALLCGMIYDKGFDWDYVPLMLGSIVFISAFGFAGYTSVKDTKEEFKHYYNYIEDNKVSLGLFTRTYTSKSNIVLANKYVILEYDISSFVFGDGEIELTDKINGITYHIKNTYRKVGKSFALFTHLCEKFDYETTADDILKSLWHNRSIRKSNCPKKLYIDINQASEAELTAIPGVTIAKAKHAIKTRNKYAFYLSVNQFYEAIELDEEFIEQIQTKGTKILLNELPEYKKIEMD